MAEPDLDPTVRDGLARWALRFSPRGEMGDIVARARRRDRARRAGTALLALGLFASAALILVPRLMRLDGGRPATQPSVRAWILVGGDLSSPVHGGGRIWVYSGRRGLVAVDPDDDRVTGGISAAVPPLAIGDDMWAIGGGLKHGRFSRLLRFDLEDGSLDGAINLPRPADVPRDAGSSRAAVASAIHDGEVLVAVGGATVAHIDIGTNEVVRTDVLGGDHGAILEMATEGEALWTLRERALERLAGIRQSVLILSGRARAMTTGSGTAWALLESGEILRRPAAGGAESFRLELEGDVSDLAYGDGRLWVVSTRDAGEAVVSALDPETGDLLGEVSLGSPRPGLAEASSSPSLVAAAGSVWVAEPTRGMLIRIDPAGRASVPIPGPTPSGEADAPWGRSFSAEAIIERGVRRPLVRGTILELSVRPERLMFRAGCNRFITPVFESGSDRLIVSSILATAVGCDAERSAQDRWLVDFFSDDPFWSYRDGRLQLTAGDRVIELEAVD